MRKSRKILIVGLVAAGTFGVVSASAATLGSLGSASVGSSNGDVASCTTTGASLAYTTTLNDGTGSFDVTGVSVTGLTSACSGKAITVALKDSSSGSVGTSATFGGTVTAHRQRHPHRRGHAGLARRGVSVVVTR